MLYSWPQRLVAVFSLCGLIFSATLFAASPGVWLDVPFIKQEKDGCGAASIAMVMQYWRNRRGQPFDASTDAAAIQGALFSAKDHGIRGADMERYFRQHGFQTFAFAGNWDDLREHLAKGRPLI